MLSYSYIIYQGVEVGSQMTNTFLMLLMDSPYTMFHYYEVTDI
jgi:hypothetical protein